MDSGAGDNVISPDDVLEQTVFESVGSKKGENFFSATGELIPNLGDIRMPMVVREGTTRGAAQHAKAVGTAKTICQAGHTVVFDEQGSFIVDKPTGEINTTMANSMLGEWVPPGYHGEDCKQGIGRHP